MSRKRGEGFSENGDAWLQPEVEEEKNFDLKVDQIVRLLAVKDNFPKVNNFYADSEDRQTNLKKYFKALFRYDPQILFIGEAPGVRGCALTGIPFTSERLINEGRFDRYFPGARFVVSGNSYESSAAYFWEMIDRMPKPPVLWNVFPLNPIKMIGGKIQNRAPQKMERDWGRQILLKILDLFPGIKVVSVGNHAKKLCAQLEIKTEGHIIHPAYHPKEFREQSDQFLTGT